MGFITEQLEAMKGAISEGFKQALIDLFKSFGGWLFRTISGASYWICLVVAVISLLAYIVGFKKAAKFIPLSFLVYFILESIKAVFAI